MANITWTVTFADGGEPVVIVTSTNNEANLEFLHALRACIGNFELDPGREAVNGTAADRGRFHIDLDEPPEVTGG